MSDTLRILVAHNHYLVPGGEDISTRHEVEMLRAAGHHVDLWETSNEAISEIGLVRAGLSAVWSRRACAELTEKLARSRYDILHVQNHFPLLSPALHRVAARRGVATVQHLRNFRLICANASFFRDGRDCHQCEASFMPWRGVVNRCYRDSAAASLAPMMMVGFHKAAGTWNQVDAFIAISDYVAEMHRQAGYPAERIVVRSCLATAQPQPPRGTKRMPAIVAAARLSPEKGLHVLIEAWRQRRTRDAVLHIAGTGPEERRLRALAQDCPTIRFEGQIAFEQLIALMGQACAVVNPSLWNEPFGRTPMEAFSVATPAIVSRAGGLVDIVEHGLNGLLVEPGDVAGLAQAIDAMLAQDDAHRAMSEGAARAFREKFSPAALLPATEKIYEDAMRRRRMQAPNQSRAVVPGKPGGRADARPTAR